MIIILNRGENLHFMQKKKWSKNNQEILKKKWREACLIQNKFFMQEWASDIHGSNRVQKQSMYENFFYDTMLSQYSREYLFNKFYPLGKERNIWYITQ